MACATQVDALALPFADDSFDRIIASEVLEHIPDDVGALAELARVLRPEGTIAVTVPAYLPERLCWALSDDYHAPKAVGGHVRIYREVELRSRMVLAGLDPTGTGHAHSIHSPYWWLRCAVGPENGDHMLVRPYRRLLEWDIMTAPWITRTADRMLNPVIGKSLVVYATRTEKEDSAGRAA
jgi:SAM-dependent methyltransferase